MRLAFHLERQNPRPCFWWWQQNKSTTVLTESEEKLTLEKWCKNLTKFEFPLKSEDLINTVQTIIVDNQRPTQFLNCCPERKWYMGFLERHPSPSLGEAKGINKGLAVITEEYNKKWFNELNMKKTSWQRKTLMTFWMTHREYLTKIKPALLYVLKPEKSWNQKDMKMCTVSKREIKRKL